MTTQPKSPGGKPQGTTPPGATQRKSGNQKAPKKVAAEQTGAAKRDEIAQKASTPTEDAVQKAKASRVEASHKVKASEEAAPKTKLSAEQGALKAKTTAAEAAKKKAACGGGGAKSEDIGSVGKKGSLEHAGSRACEGHREQRDGNDRGIVEGGGARDRRGQPQDPRFRAAERVIGTSFGAKPSRREKTPSRWRVCTSRSGMSR
jgi:hypothetical protein